jgi:IS1 family transposase
LTEWQQAPDDLAIGHQVQEDMSKLQVFGIQLDEMWSFVGKKQNKKWVWIAYEPVNRLVVAFHIGGRGLASAKQFWCKVPPRLRESKFETDEWKAYKKIVPENNHRVGKDFTYYIEGFNALVRSRVARLVRKSLSFSKKLDNHCLAIKWFFRKFNLQNLSQPYI